MKTYKIVITAKVNGKAEGYVSMTFGEDQLKISNEELGKLIKGLKREVDNYELDVNETA